MVRRIILLLLVLSAALPATEVEVEVPAYLPAGIDTVIHLVIDDPPSNSTFLDLPQVRGLS